jgi:O-succinylbenzoic acid--CoA ligase
VEPRLVALDRAGGPAFVEELQRIWERGDAAFPVDQRLPPPAREELRAAMRVGEPVEPGDALVVATSGSTGTPKGVVLTHDAVAASACATSERLAVSDDDHWLSCLPPSHVGGLSVITRALHTGTRLTVHPGFDATAVMDAARYGGVTLVSLVATALARIDPTLFRTIVLGGARPPADRPANTVTTYGMTETGSGVVYDGRPLDGVDVEIAEDGEIRLRGPMLLRCYRDGSTPLTPDGWLPTGDLGRWLDDGRLHVVGRRGDLIVTGGENVWPEAVEAVLATQ